MTGSSAKPVLRAYIYDWSGQQMTVDEVMGGVAEVQERLRVTDPNGFGSFEISHSSSAWPMVSILVNQDWCAIHLTAKEEGPMYILEAAPTDETPEVLEMEFGGRCEFTRTVLHPLATADAVVRDLAEGRVASGSSSWVEM